MAPSADSEFVSLYKCVLHGRRSNIGCRTVEADCEVAKLGLTFDTLPPGLVVVSEVLPDCWAELSGLEAGDVVTAIQGRSVLNLPEDEFVSMIQERPLALSVSRPNKEADQSTQGDEFPAATALYHSTMVSLGQRRPDGASFGPLHRPLKCKVGRPHAQLSLGQTRAGGAPYGPLHRRINRTAERPDSQVVNRNSVPLSAVAGKAICGITPSVRYISPSMAKTISEVHPNSLRRLSESMAKTIDEDDTGASVSFKASCFDVSASDDL